MLHMYSSKTITYYILVLVILMMPLTSFSEDFKTPHRVKPGDVISADVINEIFDYFDTATKSVTIENIVGQWACIKFTPFNPETTAINSDYSFDSSGFFQKTNINFTVTSNPDGSFSWNSEPLNAFGHNNYPYPNSNEYSGRSGDECPGTGKISSLLGKVAVRYNNCLSDISGYPNYTILLPLNIVSKSRIEMSAPPAVSLTCDKMATPPAIPDNLSATIFYNTVTLTWIDKSSDEEGFSIMRRDLDVTKQYTEIATVSADTTTYQDTLTTPGTYWYRIVAINANGNSLGSNVIKVTIK